MVTSCQTDEDTAKRMKAVIDRYDKIIGEYQQKVEELEQKVKALEQQPQDGDLISRKAVINAFCNECDISSCPYRDKGKKYASCGYVDTLKHMPSVSQPKGDLISKADMIKFLQRGREYIGRNRDQYKTASEFDVADTIYVNMIQAVEMMQSVPKTIVNNGTLNIQM